MLPFLPVTFPGPDMQVSASVSPQRTVFPRFLFVEDSDGPAARGLFLRGATVGWSEELLCTAGDVPASLFSARGVTVIKPGGAVRFKPPEAALPMRLDWPRVPPGVVITITLWSVFSRVVNVALACEVGHD